MQELVFDIEANGFNPDKIHCLGVCASHQDRVSVTDKYENMGRFFGRTDCYMIAHNAIRYDKPAVEKVLGIQVNAIIIDTLALSWYLYPSRKRHGLADWGVEFGVPKPPVEDWENQPIEVYLHRVEEDVKINTMLWRKIRSDLLQIYGTEDKMFRFIKYLTFKMMCAAKQEENQFLLDTKLAQDTLDKLTEVKEERFSELKAVMPSVPIYKTRKRPAKPYKKNGELSAIGQSWVQLLKDKKLPEHTEQVKVLDKHEEPKPSSHQQLKSWLFGLGWIPETFEYKRNKETGEVRKIPQIGIKNSGGDVCPSIKRLFEKEPALRILEGLSIATHRISIFKGFLESVGEDGHIPAQVQGLTNTLRFKHKTLVNLPAVDKPYGKEVRGCLTAPEGFVLCGSDMSSLEDRTKQHYMWDYDPDYVKEMIRPDFDPHLDIAVQAKGLTEQQVKEHKEGKANYKKERHKYKQVNYSAVYGAGAPNVARSAGVPEKEAQQLLDVYWKRNWSVKAIAKDCEVKVVNGQMWLYNPVSRFWYSLRYEKDRFSTLNQGTGVFCFDTWVYEMFSKGLIPIGQFHDEVILITKIGDEEKTELKLKESVQKVNKILKLNRELDVDVQFGNNYSEIH